MTKRILLADDEPDILKAFSVRLTSRGYEVLHATNGQEALAVARAQRPDLVILDQHMPPMDGSEVCQRLKGDPDCQAIPVLLLTATSGYELQELKVHSGADYVMVKLVSSDYLLVVIEELFTRRAPP